ncbi:Aste57867_13034 [Aphanomyces stellatus]|uniref:Aste57867_13034 protein n=1 Tax=Aphanomyces stellatus TaxID=120398 RepID=A0A485KX52_9STRA|nr:hypothetical protein As57867_012986 [Aphanomyces stellatus]VFT89879.1 Aste57867_13034 [Aphanomyces stellatus]
MVNDEIGPPSSLAPTATDEEQAADRADEATTHTRDVEDGTVHITSGTESTEETVATADIGSIAGTKRKRQDEQYGPTDTVAAETDAISTDTRRPSRFAAFLSSSFDVVGGVDVPVESPPSETNPSPPPAEEEPPLQDETASSNPLGVSTPLPDAIITAPASPIRGGTAPSSVVEVAPSPSRATAETINLPTQPAEPNASLPSRNPLLKAGADEGGSPPAATAASTSQDTTQPPPVKKARVVVGDFVTSPPTTLSIASDKARVDAAPVSQPKKSSPTETTGTVPPQAKKTLGADKKPKKAGVNFLAALMTGTAQRPRKAIVAKVAQGLAPLLPRADKKSATQPKEAKKELLSAAPSAHPHQPTPSTGFAVVPSTRQLKAPPPLAKKAMKPNVARNDTKNATPSAGIQKSPSIVVQKLGASMKKDMTPPTRRMLSHTSDDRSDTSDDEYHVPESKYKGETTDRLRTLSRQRTRKPSHASMSSPPPQYLLPPPTTKGATKSVDVKKVASPVKPPMNPPLIIPSWLNTTPKPASEAKTNTSPAKKRPLKSASSPVTTTEAAPPDAPTTASRIPALGTTSLSMGKKRRKTTGTEQRLLRALPRRFKTAETLKSDRRRGGKPFDGYSRSAQVEEDDDATEDDAPIRPPDVSRKMRSSRRAKAPTSPETIDLVSPPGSPSHPSDDETADKNDDVRRRGKKTNRWHAVPKTPTTKDLSLVVMRPSQTNNAPTDATPPKRGRGRPKKWPVAVPNAQANAETLPPTDKPTPEKKQASPASTATGDEEICVDEVAPSPQRPTLAAVAQPVDPAVVAPIARANEGSLLREEAATPQTTQAANEHPPSGPAAIATPNEIRLGAATANGPVPAMYFRWADGSHRRTPQGWTFPLVSCCTLWVCWFHGTGSIGPFRYFSPEDLGDDESVGRFTVARRFVCGFLKSTGDMPTNVSISMSLKMFDISYRSVVTRARLDQKTMAAMDYIQAIAAFATAARRNSNNDQPPLMHAQAVPPAMQETLSSIQLGDQPPQPTITLNPPPPPVPMVTRRESTAQQTTPDPVVTHHTMPRLRATRIFHALPAMPTTPTSGPEQTVATHQADHQATEPPSPSSDQERSSSFAPHESHQMAPATTPAPAAMGQANGIPFTTHASRRNMPIPGPPPPMNAAPAAPAPSSFQAARPPPLHQPSWPQAAPRTAPSTLMTAPPPRPTSGWWDFFWPDGTHRRVPPKWSFPDMPCRDLWTHWFCHVGQVCPYRFLRNWDMPTPRAMQELARRRLIFEPLEAMAAEMGISPVAIAQLTPYESTRLFDACFAKLLTLSRRDSLVPAHVVDLHFSRFYFFFVTMEPPPSVVPGFFPWLSDQTIRRTPESNWTVPDCTCHALWHLWFRGDPSIGMGPYRLVTDGDLLPTSIDQWQAPRGVMRALASRAATYFMLSDEAILALPPIAVGIVLIKSIEIVASECPAIRGTPLEVANTPYTTVWRALCPEWRPPVQVTPQPITTTKTTRNRPPQPPRPDNPATMPSTQDIDVVSPPVVPPTSTTTATETMEVPTQEPGEQPSPPVMGSIWNFPPPPGTTTCGSLWVMWFHGTTDAFPHPLRTIPSMMLCRDDGSKAAYTAIEALVSLVASVAATRLQLVDSIDGIAKLLVAESLGLMRKTLAFLTTPAMKAGEMPYMAVHDLFFSGQTAPDSGSTSRRTTNTNTPSQSKKRPGHAMERASPKRRLESSSLDKVTTPTTMETTHGDATDVATVDLTHETEDAVPDQQGALVRTSPKPAEEDIASGTEATSRPTTPSIDMDNGVDVPVEDDGACLHEDGDADTTTVNVETAISPIAAAVATPGWMAVSQEVPPSPAMLTMNSPQLDEPVTSPGAASPLSEDHHAKQPMAHEEASTEVTPESNVATPVQVDNSSTLTTPASPPPVVPTTTEENDVEDIAIVTRPDAESRGRSDPSSPPVESPAVVAHPPQSNIPFAPLPEQTPRPHLEQPPRPHENQGSWRDDNTEEPPTPEWRRVRQQRRASTQEVVVPPPSPSRGMPAHVWPGGARRQVPPDWIFPNLPCRPMWIYWFLGDPVRAIPPFRLLAPQDLIGGISIANYTSTENAMSLFVAVAVKTQIVRAVADLERPAIDVGELLYVFDAAVDALCRGPFAGQVVAEVANMLCSVLHSRLLSGQATNQPARAQQPHQQQQEPRQYQRQTPAQPTRFQPPPHGQQRATTKQWPPQNGFHGPSSSPNAAIPELAILTSTPPPSPPSREDGRRRPLSSSQPRTPQASPKPPSLLATLSCESLWKMWFHGDESRAPLRTNTDGMRDMAIARALVEELMLVALDYDMVMSVETMAAESSSHEIFAVAFPRFLERLCPPEAGKLASDAPAPTATDKCDRVFATMTRTARVRRVSNFFFWPPAASGDQHVARTPPTWAFPSTTCRTLWYLWFRGDTMQQIGPLRFLQTNDVHDRKVLEKARVVMRTLVGLARAPVVTIAAMDQATFVAEFEFVYGLLMFRNPRGRSLAGHGPKFIKPAMVPSVDFARVADAISALGQPTTTTTTKVTKPTTKTSKKGSLG